MCSDYILCKHCFCVRFGDLEVTPSEDAMSLETHAQHIWKRRDIAKQLEMSEERLIDWCILIGNNFTEEFSLDMYCDGMLISSNTTGTNTNTIENNPTRVNNHDHSSQLQGIQKSSNTLLSSDPIETIHALKDIIKSYPASRKIYSSDVVLQYAIECSRDFYELRELPSLVLKNEGNCKETDDASVMSSVQRRAMIQWMERYLANVNLQSSSARNDLLTAVLTALRELGGHGNGSSKAINEETFTSCFSNAISLDHLGGFKTMLERIYEFGQVCLNNIGDGAPGILEREIPHIIHDDIVACHMYQESCLIMHQVLKQHPNIPDDHKEHLLYHILVGCVTCHFIRILIRIFVYT